MIKNNVTKELKKALNRFADQEKTKANGIAFFIHTKPTKAEPKLNPLYFYAVNGDVVTEGEGIKHLRFTKDILGKKFDLMGTEMMAGHFLANYFSTISEKHNISPEEIYIMITTESENAEKLIVIIYNGADPIEEVSLEQIFGE